MSIFCMKKLGYLKKSIYLKKLKKKLYGIIYIDEIDSIVPKRDKVNCKVEK